MYLMIIICHTKLESDKLKTKYNLSLSLSLSLSNSVNFRQAIALWATFHLFVCLSVSNSIFSEVLIHIFIELRDMIEESPTRKPIQGLVSRSKVKVKVTKKVKITFLVITSVLIKISTWNQRHSLQLRKAHRMIYVSLKRVYETFTSMTS